MSWDHEHNLFDDYPDKVYEVPKHAKVDFSVWACADGQRIPVRQMTESHIRNALRLMERKGFVSERTLLAYMSTPDLAEMAMDCFMAEQRGVFDSPVCPWVDILEDELKRRGLKT